MSQRRSQEKWLDIIQECRSSGYTDREWCMQNGIAISTFYKHLKHFREHAPNIEVAPARTVVQEQQEVVSVDFFENAPAHNLPNNHEVALHLNMGNVSIDVLNGADKSTIENTLLALRSLC